MNGPVKSLGSFGRYIRVLTAIISSLRFTSHKRAYADGLVLLHAILSGLHIYFTVIS